MANDSFKISGEFAPASHPWDNLLYGGQSLSGFVLMGDSWLGSNGALVNILAKNTDRNVYNVAIGGSTTKDTLSQLNSFISAGGSIGAQTTFIVNLGINDFLQGKNHSEIEDNLNQIIKTLGDYGVKIVLSGAPEIRDFQDLQFRQNDSTNTNPLKIASLYSNVSTTAVEENIEIIVVDVMPKLLSNDQLIYHDGIHTNIGGQVNFNAALGDGLVAIGAVENMNGWGLSLNEVKAWELADKVFGEQVVIESVIQDRNSASNNTGEVVKWLSTVYAITEGKPEIQGLPEEQHDLAIIASLKNHILSNPTTWKDDFKAAFEIAQPEPKEETQNSFTGPIDDFVNIGMSAVNSTSTSFEELQLQLVANPQSDSFAQQTDQTNYEQDSDNTNKYWNEN